MARHPSWTRLENERQQAAQELYDSDVTTSAMESDMGRITWRGGKAQKGPRSEFAVHIGRRILALREKRQVSMRAVADATGLSNAFICQLENGQSVPSAETLWKLAGHFDVGVEYFFDGYQGGE